MSDVGIHAVVEVVIAPHVLGESLEGGKGKASGLSKFTRVRDEDTDRMETNFRLVMLSQRETNAKLSEVGTGLRTMAAQMAAQMEALAAKVDGAVAQSEETAQRMEDTLLVMKSFADGQVEIRATLADCVRRLDALEGKKAS